MAVKKILVSLLNFHGVWSSHVEILLKTSSSFGPVYFLMSRWAAEPQEEWSLWENQHAADTANSIYSFEIVANPEDIAREWLLYLKANKSILGVCGKNCAVAAQWFLTKYAGIPKPNLSNVSVNYLSLGIFWPSFIPCPVALPGRVMSNLKFYHRAVHQPEIADVHSTTALLILMVISSFGFVSSSLGLGISASLLSDESQVIAITTSVGANLASSYGFFKSHNRFSAKRLGENIGELVAENEETEENVELVIVPSNVALSAV